MFQDVIHSMYQPFYWSRMENRGIASLSGKDHVSNLQGTGWAPGPGWASAEHLAPPGFDPRAIQPIASRYTN
jgi:hypothetical protein